MSLYFICGKVGAGKTYRGVENIRDELLRTERLIVTNLPLLVDNLKAYFEKHHPERVPCFFDHWREALPSDYLPDGTFRPGVVAKAVEGSPLVFVPSRVRFLADEQLAEFYRFRHTLCEPARRIPEAERKGGKSNPLCLDFAPWLKGGAYEGQGVAYHLDEGQLFYNVRRYADAPEEFPFYLAQHRKLGDDIYCYTQQPQNVDKMFRSFTQEFIYIVNIGKKRVGFFKMPKLFRFCAYPEPYTGMAGQTAQYSGFFRMDLELAGCYNTAAGIGIEAVKADKGEVRRGMPWQLVLIVPVVIFIVLFCLPRVAKKGLDRAFQPFTKATAHVAMPPGKVAPAPMLPRTPSLLPVTQPAVAPVTTSGKDRPPSYIPAPPKVSEEVFFNGYTQTGTNLTVFLSDGRSLQAGKDRELTLVTPRYVVVDGTLYRRKTMDEQVRDAEEHSREREFPGDFGKPSNAKLRAIAPIIADGEKKH